MKQFNFNTLSKTPSKFYRYTGLSVGEFFILVDQIEPLWQEAERKRLSRPNRQRAIGGGEKWSFRKLRKWGKGEILSSFTLLRTIFIKTVRFKIASGNLRKICLKKEA